MIEALAERLVKRQSKKPWPFILVILVITAFMLPGTLKLMDNVEPSLEKVLPQEVQEVKLLEDMRTQFSADMTYIVLKSEPPLDDIRKPESLEYIRALSSKLITQDNVHAVSSIADPVVEMEGTIPEDLESIKDILRSDPRSAQLANPDNSMTIIMLRTDTGADAQIISNLVEATEESINSLEGMNPGLEASITGSNAIDRATFSVIINDFKNITGLSFALVMLLVLLTFRKPRRVLVALSVVMIALIWTLGITGYLGLTITVVTMVAAAMIMGLGIDFAIHVMHTYLEERKRKSKTNAMKETIRQLLRAMMTASLTTTAGFLALLFGVLPAMRILGIVLAIGITSTLIVASTFLPALILLTEPGGKQK